MIDSIKKLATYGFKVNISAGSTLFHQGELAHSMYYIEKGEVVIEDAEGNIHKTLSAGDYFGELAMVIKQHLRSANAKVTKDATLYIIDESIYDQVAISHPEVVIDILEHVANYLYNSEQNLATRFLNSKEQSRALLDNTRSQGFDRKPVKTAQDYHIKGYELEYMLGKGTYAEVFLAKDIKTGKKMAIKVYDLQAENHEEVYQHFFSELETLSNLDHPNICKIIDYSIHDDFIYTVLNYRSGGTLYQHISHKQLPLQQVFHYFKIILEALEYLHLNGVVHKDLKAQNILTSQDGNLFLSDFGSSNLPEDSLFDIHGKDIVMLSPYYMSPEQTRNEELDYLTDYYSLGILLYEMLTGTKPFIRKSIKAMVKAHRHEKTPRLPANRAVFQTLVDKLTEKDKYQRYQKVVEIKRDLAKAAKQLQGRERKTQATQ